MRRTISTAVSAPHLVAAAMLLVLGGGDLVAQDTTTKAMNIERLRRQRKGAAHRNRRIIFNNDGCDVTHFCKEATPEALLALRTTPLVGTQVDTIVYNTGGAFGLFRHNTKVGQVFSCREEGFAQNKTQDFIDQGADALQIVVDYCHKNGIESFWSMRMNDIHDSYNTWYAPYLHPKLKRENPDWLLGTREKPPTQGRMWSAVDYGRKEIQDLVCRFFEEVCRNYDADGVEMDFFCLATHFNGIFPGGFVRVFRPYHFSSCRNFTFVILPSEVFRPWGRTQARKIAMRCPAWCVASAK